MKKEKFGIIIIGLIVLLSINMVFALEFDLEEFITNIGEGIGSIFAPIFGVSLSSEFMFAKVLLFFLLFSVIYMVTQRIKIFDENNAVQIVVALVFSILSVRYLKESEIMRAVLLPSGVLGASITIFLPLLIFFFFLHSSGMGGFGRRAGWFIYGSVFLVFWLSREYTNIGEANWIYILGLGFVIISLIFDKQVHEYFKGIEFEGAGKDYKEMLRIKILRNIKEVGEAYKDGLISKAKYDSQIKKLKKKYKKLG